MEENKGNDDSKPGTITNKQKSRYCLIISNLKKIIA